MVKVGIVMGSTSDKMVMDETCKLLSEFGIEYEVRILSAHRTPDEAISYARGAYDRGLKVLIAGAGGAAHLAGVLAGVTTLPVIGVPMSTNLMGGLDSLLSIVQMPAGVPVATVAVGKSGAKNAAVLALTILGLSDESYHQKLVEYKESMRQAVLANNEDGAV